MIDPSNYYEALNTKQPFPTAKNATIMVSFVNGCHQANFRKDFFSGNVTLDSIVSKPHKNYCLEFFSCISARPMVTRTVFANHRSKMQILNSI